ncbi:hypothetical protein [Kribbella monticola]|uniref:hypothetical protein n=1 Tax=Kribbella monticola TaxID=2185285 RepID=UPI000DD2BDA7|nr:hypothetical protein [Kribbella monticola]
MRALGVNYDTGLSFDGRSTRNHFDEDTVRRELRTIADELHAPAVRVSGNDLDRLTVAGAAALEAGLDLWFSPIPMDLAPDEFIAFLTDCAARAEELRQYEHEVVLVLGCELSIFCKGFVPGETNGDRMAVMTDPATWTDPAKLAELHAGLARWGEVQQRLVAAAREAFGGRITYAAGLWEDVDWSLYDIVGIDAYRDAQNKAAYGEELAARLKWGKPVAITEFGCCTYKGAGDRGGIGWTIVDRSVQPPAIAGEFERHEDEQVSYLYELVEEFDRIELAAAFWFSFAGYELPHQPGDPRHDLDLAAYGLVAMNPDGTSWRPKRVFSALAELNAARTGN